MANLEICDQKPGYTQLTDAFGKFSGGSLVNCTITPTCEFSISGSSNVRAKLASHQQKHLSCARECGHIYDVLSRELQGPFYIDGMYRAIGYVRARAEHLGKCSRSTPADIEMGSVVLDMIDNPEEAMRGFTYKKGKDQNHANTYRLAQAINQVTGAPKLIVERSESRQMWRYAGAMVNSEMKAKTPKKRSPTTLAEPEDAAEPQSASELHDDAISPRSSSSSRRQPAHFSRAVA